MRDCLRVRWYRLLLSRAFSRLDKIFQLGSRSYRYILWEKYFGSYVGKQYDGLTQSSPQSCPIFLHSNKTESKKKLLHTPCDLHKMHVMLTSVCKAIDPANNNIASGHSLMYLCKVINARVSKNINTYIVSHRGAQHAIINKFAAKCHESGVV